MNKELILKVREMIGGGFFSSGHIIVGITKRIDDKEYDMGDYIITSDNAYKKISELENIGKEYKEMGYKLLGDWGEL